MSDNKTTALSISMDVQSQIKAFGQMPDTVKTNFLQAVALNPVLKTADPATLLLGIAKLRQMGMSIDNLDGECALIPYKDANGKTVAQIQIQWKGIRTIFLRDVKGAIDMIATPIKKGDVKSWNKLTGEMTFNEQFTSDDFEKVANREALDTMGYIGVLKVDKAIYGQENFALYMSMDDINKWANKYSKTKTTKEDWYGEKTVAKAVFRKFKHKLQFHQDEVAKDVMAFDQAVVHKVDEDGVVEVEYVDNPASTETVKVQTRKA